MPTLQISQNQGLKRARLIRAIHGASRHDQGSPWRLAGCLDAQALLATVDTGRGSTQRLRRARALGRERENYAVIQCRVERDE